MKFREYDNLKPMTISCSSPYHLDRNIIEIAKTNDIIDLQFATNSITGPKGTLDTLYSALLLVRPIE